MMDFENKIVEYVKSFGSKGKLENCTKPFKEYYEPYLEKGFEWASQKLSDIRRDGFPYFKFLFKSYVANNFKFNKRGLIYVERSIDFDINTDTGQLKYNSIGECWSWRKGNGKSYCADFGLNNNGIVTVILCGYVHPDSVDWLETVYLNSYDMKNETEIRMNNNATVEISYIKIHEQKIRLGGSFLINASADKYKK